MPNTLKRANKADYYLVQTREIFPKEFSADNTESLKIMIWTVRIREHNLEKIRQLFCVLETWPGKVYIDVNHLSRLWFGEGGEGGCCSFLPPPPTSVVPSLYSRNGGGKRKEGGGGIWIKEEIN